MDCQQIRSIIVDEYGPSIRRIKKISARSRYFSAMVVFLTISLLMAFLIGLGSLSTLQRHISRVLIQSKIPHYNSMLGDPIMEINGNNATAVLLHSNTSYTMTRLSQFDHDDGIAFYNEFRNVIISGDSLKVFDGDVLYFPGGCDLYPDPFPFERVRDAPYFDIIEVHHVLVVSQYWGDQYYHWMIEGFPRIALMHDYIQSHPHLKLLMYHHPVAEKMLGLLNIGPDRVIWYQPSLTYVARSATCPSPSLCGKVISTALLHLKHLILKNFRIKYPELAAPKSQKPFRITVQSRGDSMRSLINHKDLVRELRIAQPDALVIEFGPNEDILSAIMKHFDADIIIGPHGAGLSNVIFAPAGATMIELHPNKGNQADEGPHQVNGCHQRTAQRSGLQAILLLEDNGGPYNVFKTNIARVLDTVAKIRSGNIESVDRYKSSQF